MRILAALSFAVQVAAGVISAEGAGVAESPKYEQEANGLRIEATASVGNVYSSDGSKELEWGGAYAEIAMAVRNISSAPITVPTCAYDSEVARPNAYSVRLAIQIPTFDGKATVLAPIRFAPVTLAPGECTLLYHHSVFVRDRKNADSLLEASAFFHVPSALGKNYGWWSGSIRCEVKFARFEKKPNHTAEPNSPSRAGSP